MSKADNIEAERKLRQWQATMMASLKLSLLLWAMLCFFSCVLATAGVADLQATLTDLARLLLTGRSGDAVTQFIGTKLTERVSL